MFQRTAQGPTHHSLPAQLFLSILVFSISLGPGMLLFPARQPLSLSCQLLLPKRVRGAWNEGGFIDGAVAMKIHRAPGPDGLCLLLCCLRIHTF